MWSTELTPQILMNKLSQPRADCTYPALCLRTSPNSETVVGFALHNFQIAFSRAALLSNPGTTPLPAYKSEREERSMVQQKFQFLQTQVFSEIQACNVHTSIKRQYRSQTVRSLCKMCIK
jgi:hypothetical protein